MDRVRYGEVLHKFNVTVRIKEAFQKGYRAFSGLAKMSCEVQDDDKSPAVRVANKLARSEEMIDVFVKRKDTDLGVSFTGNTTPGRQPSKHKHAAQMSGSTYCIEGWEPCPKRNMILPR